MDKAELVQLIISRSPKLRSLRDQTANANDQKKRLYVSALLHLLEDRRTQEPAYQEITQLLATASPFIGKAVKQQIVPTLLKQHCQNTLDQYVLVWGKMLDGSVDKKQYPDLKRCFLPLKIKQEDRELSQKLRLYLVQFQKNYNQRNDERVQFFQDFDDSMVSQSIENESQCVEVFYLNIMEIKAARKKLEQKLSVEALNEQLNKLRYFLTLKPPSFLSQNQLLEYEKERQWAKSFLQTKEDELRRNPNPSINETLQLQDEVQEIDFVNKQPKPRTFKKPQTKESNSKQIKRQFFQDSLELTDRKDMKKGFKSGQPAPSPIKLMDDPRYTANISSRNSSLQIHNGYRSQPFANYNPPLIQTPQEQILEEQLVIHKVKPQNLQPTKAKPIIDFSVTEQYFRVGDNHQMLSPRAGAQSQTQQGWAKTSFMSPSRSSRCKLSKFTSQKKNRKTFAVKDQLSTSEPYVIQPYLQYFANIREFNGFRRNCFDKVITLIGSPLLTVTCLLQKETNSKLRFEMIFMNNFERPLQLETVYKVPKCFTVEKRTKIIKRFTLHNNYKHIFCLDVQEFPLQPCLLSLKVKAQDSEENIDTHVPLPLTLLNFIQYLCVTEEEWSKEWASLSAKKNRGFFSSIKHIEVDKQVVGDEIDWILKNFFVRVGSIEGYSIQDYGCTCFYQGLQGLKFLLRLSVRVDNLVSLQTISCRPITQNQQQFIEYCLNLWLMLLGKLYT